MARMWVMQPNEVHKQWLETIVDEASDKLTDWETKFIASIAVRIENGASITQSQEETLEKIYAEKTA